MEKSKNYINYLIVHNSTQQCLKIMNLKSFCMHLVSERTKRYLSETATHSSLRKHPFLLALRRRGRFARRKTAQNVPIGEEQGEMDVFAGYHSFALDLTYGAMAAARVF